jgi:hypothetical protein
MARLLTPSSTMRKSHPCSMCWGVLVQAGVREPGLGRRNLVSTRAFKVSDLINPLKHLIPFKSTSFEPLRIDYMTKEPCVFQWFHVLGLQLFQGSGRAV